MSYDAKTAAQPLTGGEMDVIILQEREQRHMIGNGKLKGFHIMPSEEYCELRDMYTAIRDSNEQLIHLLSTAAGCPYDYFTEIFYKKNDDPNLPDWYFKVCKADRFTCKRNSKTICECWSRFAREGEENT